MRIEARQKPRDDAGVVPLINVVFLLLMFFLIAGTIAPKPDVPLAYPETRDSPASRPAAAPLYVSAGGMLSYRGSAIDLERLAMVASSQRATAEPAPFAIVVDRALPARVLSPVIEALSRAGVTQVRLITIRDRGAG